jgi:hypothetical protein
MPEIAVSKQNKVEEVCEKTMTYQLGPDRKIGIIGIINQYKYRYRYIGSYFPDIGIGIIDINISIG